MKKNSAPSRQLQNDGYLMFYQNALFGSSWDKFYYKIYTDSTFEWFLNKDDENPRKSLKLKRLIPFICIGRQTAKIPSIYQEHPKLKKNWNPKYLMAISKDREAKKVYWFYFKSAENVKTWLIDVIKTLPKSNLSSDGDAPPPYSSLLENERNQQSFNNNSQLSITSLNRFLCHYDFGGWFLPVNSYGLDNGQSNDDTNLEHRNSGNRNLHISE